MKDLEVVTEQHMYTGLITKETHETSKQILIDVVTNPQNNSFVYLEVCKNTDNMGHDEEYRRELAFSQCCPSAGHPNHLRICGLRGCAFTEEARHHPTHWGRNHSPPG